MLSAQAAKFVATELQLRDAAVDATFQKYEVYEFDIKPLYEAMKGKKSFNFVLQLGDKHTWPLNLSPNNLMAHNYQETTTDEAGRLKVMPPRAVETYEGYLNPKMDQNGRYVPISEEAGLVPGEVRMSIREGYLIGYVTIGNRQLFIEPLSYALKGAAANHYLLYDPNDVLQDPELTCGVIDLQRYAPHTEEERLEMEQLSELEAAMMCVEVDLLIASTFDMVTKFGSAAAVNSHTQDITNMMQPFYSFAGMQYVIVQQFTPASSGADPFTASALAEDLLTSIMTWASGAGIATHDIGQLWTARDIFGCGGGGTGLIGCAYIGVVCTNMRYNINEDFTGSISCLARLSAHELGHNWDCRHSDAETSDNIMWPSISCSATGGFSAASMAKINAHIASRTCLTNCGVPDNDLCADAQSLACGGMATGSTALATSTGAPSGCAGGGTTSAGVWFTFTGNGQITTISTAGSTFDTKINIYSGGCGNLTCIGGNDDGGPGLTSSFTFCTQNGVAYYVYLDGFLGANGYYQISRSCTPDTQAPSISCSSNVTVNNAPGLCGAIVSYPAATATDNCTVASISYSQNSGTFFPVGTTTVTATAIDAAGNSAGCNFSVTVVDNEDPIAACLNNTVYLQADGMYTLKDVDVLDFANSSDNCSFTVTGISPAVVDCDDFDTTVPVLVTITDPAGNSDNCTANVYVDKSYALPAPWSADNIGNPGPGNAYQYDPCLMPPKFFINAGAANNSITSDNLAFINQTICGNFNITVKIESVSANGWAGIHARESTAAGSRMVGAYSNLGSIVRWESRAVTNGNKSINLFSRPFPYWLRLIRQGNTFLGYYSTNGVNYSLINIQTLPLNACLDIGISAFSAIPGQPITAVFSNLSAGSGVMPLTVMPGNTVEPTGLDRQQAGIRLFPNPAQDLVTLEFPSLELLLDGYNHPTANAVTLRLRNELGQLIEERRLDELPERLDWHINTIKPGMYFIEVHAEGQAPQMLRFVKAR
jgi:hypothetical protein